MGKDSSRKPLKTEDFAVHIHKKQNTNASKEIIMLGLFPMHVYNKSLSLLLGLRWKYCSLFHGKHFRIGVKVTEMCLHLRVFE